MVQRSEKENVDLESSSSRVDANARMQTTQTRCAALVLESTKDM